MKKALIFVAIIFIGSCSDDTDYVQNEKSIYWQEEVAAITNTKPSMTYILEKHRNYNPKLSTPTNSIIFTENIELNGFVCKSWHYTITVNGDDTGKVRSASLSEAGVCL